MLQVCAISVLSRALSLVAHGTTHVYFRIMCLSSHFFSLTPSSFLLFLSDPDASCKATGKEPVTWSLAKKADAAKQSDANAL